MNPKKQPPLAIYQTKDGALQLKSDSENETIWASQKQMAQIFEVNSQAITKHIKNIYADKELLENATCSILEQVQIERNRKVFFYCTDYCRGNLFHV